MKKKISYKIGDRFQYDKDDYMLCQTGNSIVSLIDLRAGNRWEEGVLVKDVNNITRQEFDEIVSSAEYAFTKIEGKRR